MKQEIRLENFKNKFYKKFPDYDKEIICFTKKVKSQLLIKDEYGLLYGYSGNMMKGNFPNYMSALNPIEYLNNLCKNKFPEDKLNILYFSDKKNKEGNKVFLVIDTEFGLCEVSKYHLIQGTKPNILSAIDKKSYFLNQLKSKNIKIQGDIIEFFDNGFVIIETKFGKCKSNRGDLLKGVKCGIQSALDKNEFFKNQSNYIHDFKYDCSKVKFKDSHTKVIISCKEHGEFLQTPNNHLRGRGCPKCSYDKLLNSPPERFNTHKSEEWFTQATKSKKFDSFKVYIIECWNEEERFFKIGKTFQKIEYRFQKGQAFLKNYNYKIIKVFEEKEISIENSKKISELEKKLQKINNENKYKPNQFFTGYNECYLKINI